MAKPARKIARNTMLNLTISLMTVFPLLLRAGLPALRVVRVLRFVLLRKQNLVPFRVLTEILDQLAAKLVILGSNLKPFHEISLDRGARFQPSFDLGIRHLVLALGLGPLVLEPVEQHRQVIPKMPRHVLYKLSRGARAEDRGLFAPADDELAALRVARDSLHALPADFGESHGAGFDVYVGGTVASVQNRGRFPRVDLGARREVAVLRALAGLFLSKLCPAGQYCDLRGAASTALRRDADQHRARSLAEIENRAVLKLNLRLPPGVYRQYVSVSQPHALGGGVKRRAPYQFNATFGQRQRACSLSKG